MKIVIVASSLSATGPGFVAQELANNFIKLGHSVGFIALSETESDIISLDPRVKVYPLKISRTGKLKKYVKVVENCLSKLKPDVVISNGIRSDYMNAHINGKWHSISISHNNPFEDYVQQYGFIKGLLMALLQMSLFRKIDKVVTLNPTLNRLHTYFLGKKKVTLILNGVPRINVSPYSDVVLFGNVATFNSRKNQIQILDNLEHVSGVSVIFWGEGSLKKSLTKKFQSKSIVWKSFSNDKSEVFSSFKVFVSMSKSEGMPLSVLEAISAGKPLILSNIPAHRYISQFLPEYSYKLVSTDLELIDAMKYFQKKQNEISYIGNELKKVYNEKFKSSEMAKEYIVMIKSLTIK